MNFFKHTLMKIDIMSSICFDVDNRKRRYKKVDTL